MQLKLDGIEVECILGDLPHEREFARKILVDVDLELPDTAAESDSLADTVDYVQLTDAIRRALIGAKCRLVERAARVVADVCRAEPLVKGVTVRVHKANSVQGLASATCVYP